MSSNRDEPLSFINPSSSPITVSDGENSYLLDHNAQIGGGYGSFQRDSQLGSCDSNGGGDSEFGYLRPEFRKSSTVGTVRYHERHVFLCYKNPGNWPPRIEAAEFDRLPRLLSAALAAKTGNMKKETFLTICEGHDGTETSNGDVLIFPDMIRYRRLTHFDIDTFVEEVLIKDGEWLPGTPEKLKGFYVFVCCHGSRDRRCGVCGPPLVTRFKEEVESHGLQGKVSVSPCSDIGGHKYAGNVIIFGSNTDGQVTGHWYGYVAPDDVPALLEQHIMKGEIVEQLWRGQMGLSEYDQKKALELRLQNGDGIDSERGIRQSSGLDDPACGSQPKAIGCCQPDRNDTYCQNPVLSEDKDNLGINIGEAKLAAVKSKSKKQVSRSNSHKGLGSRKICAMPMWYESWEREDTYAALAVLCAAVSVGVAYSCYKQLRANGG
ncbi:hypothetical protein Nepgr_026206 [Nepenthes gracilis]|uniref:Uncharacterized protein n=1 Tax=Nepenthes gracilis TaxID=150966 RepID=A0AAD3T6E4_NEPGR|nr:hypothetical protein Nepgr_026206 [Nepenthes gracilis]